MSEQLPTEESLLNAALELPVDGRRNLVERLLESIDEPNGTEQIERAWIAEVRRRLADFRQGKEKSIPAGKVFENVRTQTAP